MPLSETFPVVDPNEYNAFSYQDSYWMCSDCVRAYAGFNSKLDLAEAIEHGVVETIHEDTVQFEQYPGEIVPLEGIYCYACEAELYPPLEME